MDKQNGGVVFESVSKRYGSVTAVDGISFQIEPATLVTLLSTKWTSSARASASMDLSS